MEHRRSRNDGGNDPRDAATQSLKHQDLTIKPVGASEQVRSESAPYPIDTLRTAADVERSAAQVNITGEVTDLPSLEYFEEKHCKAIERVAQNLEEQIKDINRICDEDESRIESEILRLQTELQALREQRSSDLRKTKRILDGYHAWMKSVSTPPEDTTTEKPKPATKNRRRPASKKRPPAKASSAPKKATGA